jgi:hypothetical protein
MIVNPSVTDPSQSVTEYDGFAGDLGVKPRQNARLVMKLSQVAVTDLGRCKSLYNRYIYIFSLYTSRPPAPARAWRARTREGCVTYLGRPIDTALPARCIPGLVRSLRWRPLAARFLVSLGSRKEHGDKRYLSSRSATTGKTF